VLVRFYTRLALVLPRTQGTTTLRPSCTLPRPGEEEPRESPQSAGSARGAALAYLTATLRAQLSKAGYPVLLPPQIPVGWFRPRIPEGPPSKDWGVNFNHQNGDKFEGGSITAGRPRESECTKLEEMYYEGQYLHCDVFTARGARVNELGGSPDNPEASFFWVKCDTGFDLSVDQREPGTRTFARKVIEELVPVGVGPKATGC
jgi:hypothetical protein